MSNLEDHEREQAAITAAYEAAHPDFVPAWTEQDVTIPTPGPNDPDDTNENRAGYVIVVFETCTGTEREDALADLLADLLCDLMHWAQQNGFDFPNELNRAAEHFSAETNNG